MGGGRLSSGTDGVEGDGGNEVDLGTSRRGRAGDGGALKGTETEVSASILGGAGGRGSVMLGVVVSGGSAP